MDTRRPQLTPEQARDQLAATQTRSLTSTRDRRVHATTMVVIGVVLGLHMACRNLVGAGVYALLGLLAIGVLLAGMTWADRAARTVPRGVRWWSWGGSIASFLVGLGVVTPWLNLSAQSTPNTWPMLLGGAAVTAVPSLIAAVVIAAGRR